MKRPSADKMYTYAILKNCAQLSIENSKRRAGRALYKQAIMEEQTRRQTPVIAPTLPFRTPYQFPKAQDVLTYHTAWATRALKEESDSILAVLNTYKVHSTIIDLKLGPKMTQYVISLDPGQSVKSVLKLEKEFQAALHCNATLRFDNGYVLLEIPTNLNTVYLGDMLIDEGFTSAPAFTMAIGMGVDGSKCYIDIKKACHVLISGMTGSGKSIMLHNLIISLLMKQTPDKMHLYLIDPKSTEFAFYKGLYTCTMLSDSRQADGLLNSLCEEMDRRYSVLQANGCRDIDSFNDKFPSYPMRREIVVIDELSDLMYTSGKSVETSIVRIAQKARACGIHLIIATQYPVAKVVTGLIKANMPTKICLRVGTTTNSMVALDMPGGEKLMGHGDMLFLPNGSLSPIRLQGGFVSESEINNVVYALMENQ